MESRAEEEAKADALLTAISDLAAYSRLVKDAALDYKVLRTYDFDHTMQ